MNVERPPHSLLARQGKMDKLSAGLVALGVLLPLVAVAQPVQPVRALAAASVVMLLPGAAVVRLVRLRDPLLVLVAVPSTSLALTVLVSTGLMYVGSWTWQLTLALLGGLTAAVAAASGLVRDRT
jgi:hypothetical protein